MSRNSWKSTNDMRRMPPSCSAASVRSLDLLVDVPLVEQPLQLGAGIDAALQHAAAKQIQETVCEHLGTAIQSAVERRSAAFGLDQAAVPREQAERLDHVAIDRRLLMAQLQGVHDCIAELADAELQRAAVADQRAHVQRNRILGARNRRIRRTEQPRARILQQVVEGVCRDQRVAVHERQLAVDLADQRERPAARAHLRDLRQQVGGEVRVCAEAQQARGRFTGRRSRDQLREHVQSASQGVACDVRVVRAEIILLQLLAAQPRAGLEEEFDDFDVSGQPALLDQPDVFQLGISAEHALRQRLDQASLEIAAPARHAQRQGRDDREADRRVGERARDEGVDQPVRLADGDRQTQHHVFADAAQGCFDALFGTGIANRRRLIHAAIQVFLRAGRNVTAIRPARSSRARLL